MKLSKAEIHKRTELTGDRISYETMKKNINDIYVYCCVRPNEDLKNIITVGSMICGSSIVFDALRIKEKTEDIGRILNLLPDKYHLEGGRFQEAYKTDYGSWTESYIDVDLLYMLAVASGRMAATASSISVIDRYTAMIKIIKWSQETFNFVEQSGGLPLLQVGLEFT